MSADSQITKHWLRLCLCGGNFYKLSPSNFSSLSLRCEKHPRFNIQCLWTISTVHKTKQRIQTGSATLGLHHLRHYKLVDNGRFHLYSGNTVEMLPLLPKQCKWQA